MWKITFTLVIYLILPMLSFGQKIHLTANKSSNFIDLKSDIEYRAIHSHILLNYNTAAQLSKPIEIEVGENTLNQCNIYTVYKPYASTEQQIWTIKSDKDYLSLTDRRIVDYTKGKFMNFVNKSPNEPQLVSYQHYQNTFPGDKLLIGSLPSDTNIPIGSFQGVLSELIVFDHLLSPMAKQQVESYLALKYSIPLAKGLDYVNGKGDKIWKSNFEQTYYHRIAGIGRDDITGFNQKQSKSSLGNGSVSWGLSTIETTNRNNTSTIHDNTYLLWSDDDGLLEFTTKNARPSTFQRRWKLYTHNFPDNQELAFRLDHDHLEDALNTNENYWLVLGASTEDILTAEHYQLYKHNDGLLSESIKINTSENQFYTFIKAPSLWVAIDITQPTCKSADGLLLSKIVGGKSPYKIKLIMDDEVVDNQIILDNEVFRIDNLPQGNYTMLVTDTEMNEHRKSFYTNNQEIPSPDIKEKYVIDSEELIIDASINMPNGMKYQWHLDGQLFSDVSRIKIHDAGQYHLQITNHDCIFQMDVEVVQISDNIKSLNVFPNPTALGYYEVNAELKEKTPYTITITDLNGRIIKSIQHSSTKYIQHQDWISQSGVYLVTLQSGADVVTKKLIVL